MKGGQLISAHEAGVEKRKRWERSVKDVNTEKMSCT